MDIVINRLFDTSEPVAIPSYLVTSTAPFNIEDGRREVTEADETGIQEVIDHLYKNSQASQQSGLVITIHGYNTGPDNDGVDGVLDAWYRPLTRYINHDDRFIQAKANQQVYLGYRWPSESLKKSGTRLEALRALPVLLNVLVFGGLAIALIALLLDIVLKISFMTILIGLGVLLFGLVFCLYFLRISVYFRDSYRATFFGVTDLVELIRRLDQGLMERKMKDTLTDDHLAKHLILDIPQLQNIESKVLKSALQTIRDRLAIRSDLPIDRTNPEFLKFITTSMDELPDFASDITEDTLCEVVERIAMLERTEFQHAQAYWEERPIKLSFIGHSMGGHVTTQAIRILSDVFDPRSVGTVGESSSSKMPSPRVGRVFSLGRMILVSPDIPVLAITSGRSNFLRSSLRRFEEAYLFSNEGDLALRIASTAANYFSFPARSRLQGYRLGNVTIKGQRTEANGQSTQTGYGIANLAPLLQNERHHLLPYLEVSVLNEREKQSLDPRFSLEKKQVSRITTIQDHDEAMADLFTYFDCTEYRDYTDYKPHGQDKIYNLLTLDHQKSPIQLLGYLKLLFAYSAFSSEASFPKGRDVHGGYFAGRFSKLLIYRLAFLGFSGLLESLLETSPESLGIGKELPPEIEDELTQARRAKASTLIPGLINVNEPQVIGRHRVAALQYLSWICQQKFIQAAISPERFKVNIEGRNKQVVREEILL